MGICDYFRRTKYLYHGTRTSHIPQIRNEGLDPKYFARGVIFLSDSPGFSAAWGRFEALIKVREEDLDPDLLTKSVGYEWEYRYASIIPPKVLTIHTMNKYGGKVEVTNLVNYQKPISVNCPDFVKARTLPRISGERLESICQRLGEK